MTSDKVYLYCNFVTSVKSRGKFATDASVKKREIQCHMQSDIFRQISLESRVLRAV